MTAQPLFKCSLHLFNRLCHCPIQFSSQAAPDPIGQDNNFVFNIDHSYMIALLSSFHHRPHPIKQVPTILFWFWCRLDLYDQSYCCTVWFLSQIRLSSISHENSVSFSTQTTSIRLVIQLSYLVFIIDYSWSDLLGISVSFSVQTMSIQQVT